MFCPGFVMYLVASMCGVAAVRHWRRAQIPPWQGMGLRFDTRALTDLGSGIVIGTLVMGGIFGVERALGVLHVRGVQIPNLDWAIWLPALAFLAFGEEVAYRSLMLNGLLVMLQKRWLAVIVMAACFGLAHVGNPNASALSVLGNALGGLMYGVAFLGSGRIWLPLGLHFAWNFIQAPVLGFPFLGKEIGLVQQTPVGNALITGGGYGPEAGLVGMAFRFVAIALLAGWLSWRSEGKDIRRKPK
ncbi:MAG: CPBP family intramembrane glutamic endopeptidase [Chloroflexota bacterium]|nr:CPBP family intramembrane glutamic endopeptidase [Chloroflexota bacterium]